MIDPKKKAPLYVPPVKNVFSPQEILYLSDMRLSDLEAIRLVLNGDSVIDWFRLDFHTPDQVQLFLQVNGYDLTNVQDRKRIEKIHREAVEYLDSKYPHRIPKEIRPESATIEQLLYLASQSARKNKHQFYACMVLKIMHTINHLDARELFHRCQMRASDLYFAVERKVEHAVTTMKNNEFHIVDFYGSHKDKMSMVTKLMAKKENHAAAIYDRIRFRIITQTLEDILPVLYFLGRTICPFNYVIPGSSHNNLIAFAELVEMFPNLRSYAKFLRRKDTHGFDPDEVSKENKFSSTSYRSINIVMDIPIRVDDFLYTPDFSEFGRIIFVPVEIQIMDQMTYQNNEIGEGSHSKYKQRQMDAVNQRLGLQQNGNSPG